MSEWYLLAHHGLVLACIARQPEITARQIANTIGVTERTAHKIITDLNDAAYLKKEKVGRRNTYQVDLSCPLRHPTLQGLRSDGTHASVGDLLQALGAISDSSNGENQPPPSTPPSTRSGLRRIFRRVSKAPKEGSQIRQPLRMQINPFPGTLLSLEAAPLPGFVA